LSVSRVVHLILLFSAVLALIGLSGCSRCSDGTQAAAGRTLEPGAPHYSYAIGESLTYRFRLTQKMEIPGGLGNDQILMLRAIMTLTPVSVAADGTTTLDMTLHHVTATLSSAEKREGLDAFKDLEKARYAIAQAKDGTIVSAEQTGDVPQSMKGFADTLPRTLREMLPMLPPRLSANSDWTIESRMNESIAGFGEVPSTTRMHYRADGRETVNGNDAMKLAVDYDITIGGELVKSSPKAPESKSGADVKNPQVDTTMTIDNRGKGEGVIWFDEKTGRFVGARYETRVTVRQSAARERMAVDNSQTIVSRIEVRPSFGGGGDQAEAQQAPAAP
jgi:hypothetical protein